MTLEWFGLPDHLKRHREQIDYGLKGKTNDELRQEWMSTAVPFCESIGIDVPAHYDAAEDGYVIDCPFPVQFDEREKRWLLEEGEITWDEVHGALAPARPGERGARRDDPARTAPADGAGRLSAMATEARVRAALAEVLDPEYPVSLVDMGLVRGVEIQRLDGSRRRRLLLARLSVHRADRGRHPRAPAPARRRRAASRCARSSTAGRGGTSRARA